MNYLQGISSAIGLNPQTLFVVLTGVTVFLFGLLIMGVFFNASDPLRRRLSAAAELTQRLETGGKARAKASEAVEKALKERNKARDLIQKDDAVKKKIVDLLEEAENIQDDIEAAEKVSEEEVGKKMIIYGVVSAVIGIFWVRRVIRIEV